MKKIILAVLCLSMAACSSFDLKRGMSISEDHAQDVFLDMLSYIPAGLIDYHPADFYGTQINYFDYEKMSKDFDLPDVNGTDPWEEKLQIITAYQFEGLVGFPKDINPANHDCYGTYGFDLMDLKQSVMMVFQNTAILRGTFNTDDIDQAMKSHGYSILENGDFTIYTAEDQQYHFGVTEEIVIIAMTIDDLETLIWQKGQPETSMAEMDEIQQLVHQMRDVHGLTLYSSGDLEAFTFDLAGLIKYVPELEAYGMKDFNQYREDWSYALLTYQSNLEAEITYMDFYYIFPTEEYAELYVPLVEDCLTNTPSLGSRHYPLWSDLIALKEVEQIGTMVHATAETSRKHLLGSSFFNGDYYGLLPVREIEN